VRGQDIGDIFSDEIPRTNGKARRSVFVQILNSPLPVQEHVPAVCMLSKAMYIFKKALKSLELVLVLVHAILEAR
jgi:hypothetical protein